MFKFLLPTSLFSLLNKLDQIFTDREKKAGKIVIWILIATMILEIFGIGIIIPFLLITVKKNLDTNLELPGFLNFFAEIKPEFILLSILVFFLIKPVILYYFNFYNNRFIFTLKKNLSHRLLNLYLVSSYDKLILKNNNEIIKNIISSTARASNGFIGASILFCSESLIICGIILFLLLINPAALLFSLLIIIVLGSLFVSLYKKKLSIYGKKLESSEAEVFSVLNYSFSSIKEIKIFKLNELFEKFFDKPNSQLSDLRTKQTTIFILPRLIFETVFMSGIVIFFFIFLKADYTDANYLTVASSFALSFLRVLPSINRIFNSINTMIYTKPSIDLVYNELQSFETDNAKKLILEVGQLNEFKSISFISKSTNQKILDKQDFKFKKDKMTCLFGKSGSGKTTILDIISGLLYPDNIQINIDDTKHKSKFIWNNLAYMSQNNFYTNDTIKNNILLYSSNPNFDQNLFNKSIKFACLEDFIQSHSNKENTQVGYKGINLSGGEMQRLSLARIFYSNKNLLFFDEPTSSLDKTTENKIIENFALYLKNKTVIISTHQLNFKKIADESIDISK